LAKNWIEWGKLLSLLARQDVKLLTIRQVAQLDRAFFTVSDKIVCQARTSPLKKYFPAPNFYAEGCKSRPVGWH
jgi:hypothetical protein